MVTISRTRTNTRRPFSSIRWRILITFMGIIGASVIVMTSMLINFVSDYLYEQRIRQDSLAVEKLATTVAPLFQSASGDSLSESLTRAGGEMGGRLMVLDSDGKVQFDTYSALMGVRVQVPEVLAVLTGGRSAAYGIHYLEMGTGETAETEYAAYCTASLLSGRGEGIGVLLYVSPVMEMMENLNNVQTSLISISFAIAAAALVAVLVFSSVLTKPIINMTRTIQKMGSGDLSVRVPVKGSGELKEMAISYNNMAEQLEHQDKTRNQFVANASHELKTPMTTMKVLLESVMYQPDMPADLRGEFLSDMNHEIDRLTSIVTDLLSLTQSDSHKMKLNLTEVNLSALTEETLRLLAPTALGRGQQLRGRITPGICLKADQSKLGQVIYNLAENAIKYTPDGGKVLVSVMAQNHKAIITVKDNGIGIPKEDQLHIFDRFYRVDKARSRETGGTGLGLSIVKQMVALHGGTISVESEHGKGSTFIVVLPMDGKELRA